VLRVFSEGRKLAAPRSVCHNEMCAGKELQFFVFREIYLRLG
jgi:hypothetical protein